MLYSLHCFNIQSCILCIVSTSNIVLFVLFQHPMLYSLNCFIMQCCIICVVSTSNIVSFTLFQHNEFFILFCNVVSTWHLIHHVIFNGVADTLLSRPLSMKMNSPIKRVFKVPSTQLQHELD